MALTVNEFFEAIARHETEEEYRKRCKRLRRLGNERDDLESAIEILGEYGNCQKDFDRLEKKKKRLVKVLATIEQLS